MNRRGFFRALAATAFVAVARNTWGAQTALSLSPPMPDISAAGQRYAEYLARSMRETKEALAANILNRAFNHQ